VTVAACPKARGQQCGFFLTGEDDTAARREKSSDIQPAPHTPTRKQTSGASRALPTPDTGTGLGTRLFTANSSREGYLQKPDDTPTPHRFRADENGDLPSLIFGLLREDGITLKSSTESAIRHMIGERLAEYKAKLQNSTESLEMAFKKLDELERAGGSATS